MEPILRILVGIQKHVVRYVVWKELGFSAIQTLSGDNPGSTERCDCSEGYRSTFKVQRLLHHFVKTSRRIAQRFLLATPRIWF
jgi:hypothetical protein